MTTPRFIQLPIHHGIITIRVDQIQSVRFCTDTGDVQLATVDGKLLTLSCDYDHALGAITDGGGVVAREWELEEMYFPTTPTQSQPQE